ncbi:MAG: hypothetical protein ACPLPV_04200 [Methanomassiliicoccales archaeon]
MSLRAPKGRSNLYHGQEIASSACGLLAMTESGDFSDKLSEVKSPFGLHSGIMLERSAAFSSAATRGCTQ